MKNRRSRESYTSADKDKRQRQLSNLDRTKTASEKKTPFLADPRNRDLRYFLENHCRLESGQLIVLEDWQIEKIIEPITSGQYEIVIISTPKKAGKSTIISCLSIFSLCFSDAIAPEVYSLASSKDQARIVFEKAKKIVKRSPELRKVCKIYKDRIEVPSLDAIFSVLSAQEDSSEGLNPSAIFQDELGVSKWELWVTMLTAQGQRQGSGQKPLAVLIGTAGHNPASPFHKLIQRAEKGREPSTYCYVTHDNLASWISPRWLLSQRRRLSPQEYSRYHLNNWVSSSSSFVSQEDVDRCIDTKLSPQGIGRENCRYYVGLDVGLVRDRSVITIVHREKQRTILDSIRVYEGKKDSPVLLADLEMELNKVYKLFNSPQFIIDVWQASQLIERLRGKGARVIGSKFTTSLIQELTSNLYNIIHNGLLGIFRDEGLIDELLTVIAVQGQSGIRIDHKSGQFSDRVISLSLACLEAAKEPYFEHRPQVILGDIYGQKRSILDREIDNMRVNDPEKLKEMPAFWTDFKEVKKRDKIGQNVYPEDADEKDYDSERR